MIHYDVQQGSDEWIALRIGRPTTSMFHKIITPAKWQYSAQARGYMCRLLAEQYLNMALDDIPRIEHIVRGQQMEPQAIRAYEYEEEVSTQSVGFITTDDGRFGSTPDRLIIGANAGLEIKCPAAATHVLYSLDGFGDDYMAQAMGQVFVGEFDWVERYSYYPAWPSVSQRVERDEVKIRGLCSALSRFAEEMDEAKDVLHRRGFEPRGGKVATAYDEQAVELGQLQLDLARFLDA